MARLGGALPDSGVYAAVWRTEEQNDDAGRFGLLVATFLLVVVPLVGVPLGTSATWLGSAVRRPLGGGGGCRARPTATWLILPVVICLSQRLSHACLSTDLYTVKLRMAH